MSIFLYGCESWNIEPELEPKINSFAMSCYRSILGIKLTDHIRNADILARVGRDELLTVVHQRQLGWLGHTLRLEHDEPSRILALYEPKHGTFSRGPRRQTYKKQIAKLLSGSPDDMTAKQITELANDKTKWNKTVAAQGRT